ncbi:putative fatty acyl-CoA reductase CG5065 [Musca vetustissima]|uniref:putative fatty acyl-CoA reductase CG5065 n=2 Tax=Musca vetustissima TaxID=27455 RepID=UPI002AB74C08|nr:putative fatty acyl-CoA reductase CG5065 [Musca vetustissima]
MTTLTPVQQYYKDKTIFITGATGFMGKVLIEKLLYSCSELKEIIIICRPKRGKSPQSRLEEIWKAPIFQRIKDEKPHVLKKVTMFQGDITLEYLGLGDEDLKYVAENTNIVFHMAASLKMECPLTESINMNLAGTRRCLDVAKKMQKLCAFVHLSTTFCNYDQKVLYEQVYEVKQKPEDLMRLAEWMDVKTLDSIRSDLIKPHPNNYTYTKRLTEIYVRNHYATMPVIIARPSIVTCAYKEPLEGWIDNMNGPVGLAIAGGKGVLRSLMCAADAKVENIPVDHATTGLIFIPHYVNEMKTRPAEIPVFNLTLGEDQKTTSRWVVEKSMEFNNEYPLTMPLWYPNCNLTMNRYYHWFSVILFMWLPALLVDCLLTLCGQKRFLLRAHKRLMAGLKVLQFFTTKAWNFQNPKYIELCESLTPEEKAIFPTPLQFDKDEYMFNCCIGARQYVCKEPMSNVPRAKVIYRIMYILDRVCKILICSWFFYWLSMKLGVVDYLCYINPLHLLTPVKQ